MATEVKIPKLGLTMEEGTVAEWLVADGTFVRAGDVVYRLETDKVETEVEAESSGVLRHLVEAGTTLEPGGVVGMLLAEAEPLVEAPVGSAPSSTAPSPTAPAAEPAAAATPAPQDGNRVAASPNARRVAADLGVDLSTVTGSGPGGRITAHDVRAAGPPPTAPAGAAPTSPLVRRLADAHGVDVTTVAGTGPGGRVTRADVEAAAPTDPPPAPAGLTTDGSRIALRGMRGLIARRMHASLHEMAQLTLTVDVDMDAAVELRDELQQQWGGAGLTVPGYTDMIVKAVASALVEHPRMNAEVRDDEIVVLPGVDIGLAVALDDGLVVPVISDAAGRSLLSIAAESARLAAAARDGMLELSELEGGTFSVTSLGAYGVDVFTPIVNPPNVGILGVGRIRRDVAVDAEGSMRPLQRMTLSLTFDHRAVDGAPAARFAGSVKDLLEHPLRLLAH